MNGHTQFKPIVLNSSLIVDLKYSLMRGNVRYYNLIRGLKRNNFKKNKSFYHKKFLYNFFDENLYTINEKLFEFREMGRLFTPFVIDNIRFFYSTKLIFTNNLQYRLLILRFQFIRSLFSKQLSMDNSLFNYRDTIWKTNLFFRYIPLMVLSK